MDECSHWFCNCFFLPCLFFECFDPGCTNYLMISPTLNSYVAYLKMDSISSSCFVFDVAWFFMPHWLLLADVLVPTLWWLHLACSWMIATHLSLMAVSSSNSCTSHNCNFFNSLMISSIWTSLVQLSCPSIFESNKFEKVINLVCYRSVWTASTGILQRTWQCFFLTNLWDISLSMGIPMECCTFFLIPPMTEQC